MIVSELERSYTQVAAVHHKPKQEAQCTCPEQQRDAAHTQAERADNHNRSRDYMLFCGGGGGGSDCGVCDGLSSYMLSNPSCALVDVSLKDTLGLCTRRGELLVASRGE